jgi:histidinol-phosphate aminotransferase
MNVLDLVRPDLRGFGGYLSARKQNSGGAIWLNANEAAQPQAFDTLALNRYPEPQPGDLRRAMAEYYGVDDSALLLSRGSDEAIDLLIRALCIPGADRILIQSPTFGMYAVCARLHACTVIDSPLQETATGFGWNIPAMIATAQRERCKVLFLCSPANPTGQSLPAADLELLLDGLAGQCLVVVDEAYGEYSTQNSALALMPRYPHLAVLKTLSKAHALAGARIGGVIADPELIGILKTCQAPYPIAKPSAALALQAFSEKALATTRAGIATCLSERDCLQKRLQVLPMIGQVFSSDANFLLVRCTDADRLGAHLLAHGVVVRAMTQYPALRDCLRISIGTPAENERLLAVLDTFTGATHA